MRNKITSLIPYALILGIDFYILPFLMKNTGLAMLLTLFVMPIVALLSSLIFGTRHGFNIILPITALLMFIPTIFIFYNSSAWIYAPIYCVITLAGMLIGKMFYQK